MNRKRSFVLLLGLLALSLWGAPVFAQEDGGEEARACYERGQRYYDLKKYPEAIGEFERGYVLSGLPAFLLNIAQAYRMQGDLERAADYYRRFLDRADADDPAREGVQKILLELEGKGPAEVQKKQEPSVPLPQKAEPPNVSSPVYDGGFTQEELQEILGEEYSSYLASGLTYEAYQRRKKARLYAWGGAGVAAASFTSMLVVIAIDNSSPDGNLERLTTTFLITGILGASLSYYGFQAVQAYNLQRRPPAAASFALLPGGGSSFALSLEF